MQREGLDFSERHIDAASGYLWVWADWNTFMSDWLLSSCLSIVLVIFPL
jgi:hypothetical protein